VNVTLLLEWFFVIKKKKKSYVKATKYFYCNILEWPRPRSTTIFYFYFQYVVFYLFIYI
jgi:hypothetical protein